MTWSSIIMSSIASRQKEYRANKKPKREPAPSPCKLHTLYRSAHLQNVANCIWTTGKVVRLATQANQWHFERERITKHPCEKKTDFLQELNF